MNPSLTSVPSEPLHSLHLLFEAGKYQEGLTRLPLSQSETLSPAELHLQGNFLRELAQYSAAEECYLRALGAAPSYQSSDPLLHTAALVDLGRLYELLGRYTQADALYLRAEGVYKNHPSDRLGLARCLRRRAGILVSRNQYGQADALLTQAKELAEPLSESGLTEVGLNLDLQALMCLHRGHPCRGEDIARRAVNLLRDHLGEHHPHTTSALHTHARLLLVLFRLDDAQLILEKVQRLRRDLLGEQHPDLAATLDTLAMLNFAREDFRQAEKFSRTALAILRQTYGEEHPETAKVWQGLAEILIMDGQLDEAGEYLNLAIEVRKKTHGDNSPLHIRLLLTRSELARRRGRLTEVTQILKQAHDLATGLTTESSFDRTLAAHHLARHLMEEGWVLQPCQLTKQSLEESRLYAHDDPLWLTTHLHLRSKALHFRGEVEEADRLLQEAIDFADRLPSWHPASVQTHVDFAFSLLSKGNAPTAETTIRTLVDSTREHLGTGHTIHTNVLRVQGEMYHLLGQLERAEEIFEDTLELERKYRGDEDLQRVETLRSLARLHVTRNNPGAAEVRYRLALETRQSVLGLEHPVVAGVYQDLAGLYQRTNNLAAADALLRHALEIRRNVPGEDHREYADTLAALASVQHAMNEPASAETFLLQALKVLQADSQDEHPRALEVRHMLALVHSHRNEFRQAIRLLERTLAGTEQLLGTEHPSLITILTEQVRVHTRLGDLLSAKKSQERINSIHDRHQGRNTLTRAEDLNSLAEIYRGLGEFEVAETLGRQALAIAEGFLQRNDPTLGSYLSSLAQSCSSGGNHTEAGRLLFRAQQQIESVLGKTHPLVAHLVGQQASVCALRGNKEQATRLHRQAVDGFRLSLGEDHLEHANALRSLGLHLQQLKSYPQAIEALDRHRIITRRAFGADHPVLAWCFQMLGSVCRESGQYDQAGGHFHKAINILRRGEPGHDGLHASLLHELGLVYRQQQRFDEAVKIFRAALDIDGSTNEETGGHLETLYELGGLQLAREARDDAFLLLSRLATQLQKLVPAFVCLRPGVARTTLLLQSHVMSETLLGITSPEAARPTLEIVFRWKGIREKDLVLVEKKDLLAAYPEQGDLIDRHAWLGRQIAGRFMQGGGDGQQMHHDLLAAWQGEFDKIEEQLAASIPALSRRRALTRIDVTRVAERLPQGSCLVEFARFQPPESSDKVSPSNSSQPYYLAWILEAGNPNRVQMIRLPNVNTVHQLIHQKSRTDLMNQFMTPLRDRMPSAGFLFVACEGEIRRIDFAGILGCKVEKISCGRELAGIPVIPEKSRSWFQRWFGTR